MRGKDLVLLILISLFCLNILAWTAVYQLSRPRFLEINFFDVDQGDAIFIVTPKRHQILIDGGPSSVILEKLAKEMPFFDRTIDLIILTHPERDHLIGLIEVLKRYRIENILWTEVVKDTEEYRTWLKLVKKEKANVFIAKEGRKIKSGRVVLDVIYPWENLSGKEFKNSNDTSIVNRLIFDQNSFLFTGDISQLIEGEVLQRRINIDSDVLKVSHHGSKTSTAEEFVKKVLPKVAVIQVGKNNHYGHPHQEVLDILVKYDIKILRTDQDGDIKIISNGENLKIESQKSKMKN